VAKTAQPASSTKFDWGDLDLAPPAPPAVRPASAEAEHHPPQNARSSALQWMEPNQPSPSHTGAASAGNWKASIR
jgi:hypothetical protein